MPPTMTANQKKTSLTSMEAKLRPVRPVHPITKKALPFPPSPYHPQRSTRPTIEGPHREADATGAGDTIMPGPKAVVATRRRLRTILTASLSNRPHAGLSRLPRLFLQRSAV
jgi:hypothetical protein